MSLCGGMNRREWVGTKLLFIRLCLSVEYHVYRTISIWGLASNLVAFKGPQLNTWN